MTAALASTATAPPPSVRLRPAPPLEPPYDDELGPAWPSDEPVRRVGPHDVELPLDWGRPRRATGRTASRQRPPRPSGRTASRPGPAGWRVMADDVPLAIKRFLDMYLEVLNERRPLRHLLPYATDETFQAIRLGLARRGRGWWPIGRRPVSGRRAPTAPPQSRPLPIRVQRIRSCEPVRGVVEVTAVLRRGDEVRAIALRLERQGQHWVCTALEFIG